MPQQVVQNTAVRIVLRRGPADDADQWARILWQYDREELARTTDDLGRSTGSGLARWRRDWYVPPDELRVLGTGEAIVSVAPVYSQPPRQPAEAAAMRVEKHSYGSAPCPTTMQRRAVGPDEQEAVVRPWHAWSGTRGPLHASQRVVSRCTPLQPDRTRVLVSRCGGCVWMSASW